MPWLSIIMALISFIATKKASGGNTARAVAAGAIAGLGTYYVTHETEWGQSNLGQFDGVVQTPTTNVGTINEVPKNADGTPATKNADGTYSVTDSNGSVTQVKPGTVATIGGASGVSNNGVTAPTAQGGTTGATSGLWDTLKSWGPVGTAAVVGTTAAATSSGWSKYWPWLAGGALLLLLTR